MGRGHGAENEDVRTGRGESGRCVEGWKVSLLEGDREQQTKNIAGHFQWPVLAPPEEMKEEMNVRNTKLGTNQLFYRWLK